MKVVYNLSLVIILFQVAVNCSAEDKSNDSFEFSSTVINKNRLDGSKDVLQADNSEGMVLSEAGTLSESLGETQNDFGLMNKSLGKNYIQEIENACDNDKTFGERVKCDKENRTLIKRGYWIGNDIHHNITVVVFCKFCDSFYTDETGLFIPVKLDQCLSKREHFLCSQCKNNSAPAINSRHYECIDCDWSNIFIYIVGNFIGFFFLSAFIFVFDFFPGSGALNALVFFSQMITSTLQLDGEGMVPLSAVTNKTQLTNYPYYTIYGIWNLDFIDPVSSFCFSPKFTTVDVLAMKYGIALLFLVPVLFFVVFSNFFDIIHNTCGRNCTSWFGETFWNYIQCNCCPCEVPWLNKLIRFDKWQSIKTLVSSCLLLSFTKFTVTTFYLINPTEMYNASGHSVGKVLYYQGNIDYFEGEHLKYAVVAILVFVTFVAGFPLMLLFLRYEPDSTKTTNDQDNRSRRGLRTRRKKCATRLKSILSYLNTFLDECVLKSFQKDLRWGKRKDRPCCGFKFGRFSFGLHDYRWYAGWYFFLRLSLFAANIFPMDFVEQLIIQQLLCVLGLVISISFRPYRYWFYNRLDGFILILLIFINTLVLYQYYLTATDQPLSKFAFVMQYTLVYIPAISMIVYFFIKIGRNYFKDENEETPSEFEDTQNTGTVQQQSSSVHSSYNEDSRQFTMSENYAAQYQGKKAPRHLQPTPIARQPGVLERFKNRYLCSCYQPNTTNELESCSCPPEHDSVEPKGITPSSPLINAKYNED